MSQAVRLRSLALGMLMLLAFGCGRSERTQTDTQTNSISQDSLSAYPPDRAMAPEDNTDTDPAMAPPDTASPDLSSTSSSDATIFAVMRAANTSEVRGGRIAQARTSNDAVRAFATQMVEDHGAASQKLSDLATKLGITPRENAASRSLVANAERARARFQSKSGAEFDRAYIENEVATHQALLGLLDRSLIPDAVHAELKTLLQTQRATFHAHLDHATNAQAALAK